MWNGLMKINKFKRLIFGLLAVGFISGCSVSKDPEHENAVKMVVVETAGNMIFVKGGSFMMGDSGDGKDIASFTFEEEEKAVKEINLDSYSINKFETTWGEFATYLKDVGRLSDYDDYNKYSRENEFIAAVEDISSANYSKRPALSPSWYEADGYCKWLAEKTNKPYALPTEAQWEFAARSRGERVRYATEDGITLVLDDYMKGQYMGWDPVNERKIIVEAIDPLALPKGNAFGSSSREYSWWRRIVGSYPPNELGIHDMTGNAREWVADWYEENYYQKMQKHNPIGPAEPIVWWKSIKKNRKDQPVKTVRDWVSGSSIPGTSVGAIYGRGGAAVTIREIGFRCALNSLQPAIKAWPKTLVDG